MKNCLQEMAIIPGFMNNSKKAEKRSKPTTDASCVKTRMSPVNGGPMIGEFFASSITILYLYGLALFFYLKQQTWRTRTMTKEWRACTANESGPVSVGLIFLMYGLQGAMIII